MVKSQLSSLHADDCIDLSLCLSQSGYGLLKIQSVQNDVQLKEVLLRDDVLQVLEEIGYHYNFTSI